MSVLIVCDRCSQPVADARHGDVNNGVSAGPVLHRLLGALFWPKPTINGAGAGRPADMCVPCGEEFVAWWQEGEPDGA